MRAIIISINQRKSEVSLIFQHRISEIYIRCLINKRLMCGFVHVAYGGDSVGARPEFAILISQSKHSIIKVICDILFSV